MSTIDASRSWLCALLALVLLGGCGREEALYFDWLAGSSRTLAAEEKNSYDAVAIVEHPGSNGFAPFVVSTDAQIPIVWMLRRRATLEVETFVPAPRELLLEAAPFAGSVRFQISLDGEFLQAFEWDRPDVARILLPEERVPAGRHEIEIRLDPSVEPSHELPGTGGMRSFGFAVRRLAIGAVGGAAARVRERWSPAHAGSVLRLAGRATGGAAKLWILYDAGEETRTVLREASFDAEESFEWEIAVPARENGLHRFAVVEAGEIAWAELGQEFLMSSVPERRNLLLITLDTTRRDAFGVYRDLDGSLLLGELPSPTPRLDELAAQSIVFRRAFSSAPVTAPTHASIFLSQPPSVHGLRVNGLPLPPSSEQNMVARLHAWGYRTAAFVSLGVLAEDAGFAQDFDHFDDEFSSVWWRPAEDLNRALARWIEREDAALEGPRFLWLHYSDPHKPYAVSDEDGYGIELSWDGALIGRLDSVGRERRIPVQLAAGEHRLRLSATQEAKQALVGADQLYRIERLLIDDPRVRCVALSGVDAAGEMGELAEYGVTVPEAVAGEATLALAVEDLAPDDEIRRRYLEEVARMDAGVGAAIDRLRAKGWLDDALIAVVADHGEDLGAEDGRFGHVEHLGPTLTEAVMMIHDPRRAPGILEEPVSGVDLAPTLLRAVGLRPAVAMVGRDLLAAEISPRSLYLETFPPEAREHWRALVMDSHKLEGRVGGDGALAGGLRLFDLRSDPHCRSELLEGRERPQSVDVEPWDRILGSWSAWAGDGTAVPEVDPAMLERLRALGYVE